MMHMNVQKNSTLLHTSQYESQNATEPPVRTEIITSMEVLHVHSAKTEDTHRLLIKL